MYEYFCLQVCMYIMCVCLVPWVGQKRVLESLELELQMVVSNHVDAQNQTCVFCKSNKCSKLLNNLFSPPCVGVTHKYYIFWLWKTVLWLLLIHLPHSTCTSHTDAHTLFIFKISYFMCICVFACMYVRVPCAWLVPAQVGRRYQIPWNWSYRQLILSHHIGAVNWT